MYTNYAMYNDYGDNRPAVTYLRCSQYKNKKLYYNEDYEVNSIA